MAIVISGVNNNDKITAADGNIDLLSAVNYTNPITVTDLTASNKISSKFIDVNTTIQLGVSGVATATTFVGNLTGNVNQTSTLLLQIAGSEKFRIASSGQLGIGGANYGTAGQVLTSGGSGSAATWSTINSDAINEGNTKAEVIDSGSNGRFIVETEGSERFRIDSAGEVGIGTNNPTSKLHVASTSTTVWPFTSSVSDTYAYTPYPHELIIDNDVRGTEGSYAGIYFNAGADTDGSKVSTARIAAIDTGSYKADLVFSNRGFGGSSHKENLRITSAGNVGINTTLPSALLNVNTQASGTTDAIVISRDVYGMVGKLTNGTGALVVTSNKQLILQADPSAQFTAAGSFIGFETDGTEKVRIRNDGNVGINQTDPSRARLHVVGDNTSGDIVAKFKSGGGGADSETYIALVTGYPDNVNDYEGHAHIGVQRNGAGNGTSLVFKPHSGSGTSVTERMRITPEGSVTKPQQPYVHITGITNTGGSGTSNAGTATTYGNITYSNGRVTAQVEGNYVITFASISDNGTGRVDGNIRVNGSNIVNLLTSANGSGYRQKSASIVYHLNANDYVEWNNADWYSATNTSTAWKTATVYLLG
tara:strand:+ start:516 stop:2291 length:1776 start_codon:yes stop_codon:yes gene_type:complete